MEYQIRVNRRPIRITSQQVLAALRGVAPDPLRRHRVEIGGITYPVKQALAVALGVDRGDFATNDARRALRHLGFSVYAAGAPSRPLPEGRAFRDLPYDVPRHAAIEIGPGEVQGIRFAPVALEWCQWQWWEEIREGIYRGRSFEPPPARPGVYEVKREREQQRLVIGKAADLNRRVRYDLVRGVGAHPAGRKIRELEDLSRLIARWATTDRPAAVEEALHDLYVQRFGCLPDYTFRT